MKTKNFHNLTIGLFFISTYAFAQSQGPNNPTVATSGSNGTSVNGRAWNSDTSVFTNDGKYATNLLSYNPTCSTTFCYFSPALSSTGYGFTIPGSANIDGIVVEVERHSAGISPNLIYDSTIMLMKNAAPVGSNYASSISAWNGTESYTTYGSSTDLWGTTWTPSDINDGSFGLYLIVKNTANNNAPQVGVDNIRITVYYSAVVTGINAASISNGFSIYPNPANTKFTVNATNAMQSVSVRNAHGEVVYANATPQQQPSMEIDLSSYPKGIYFVQVLEENNNSVIKKVVLQ